MEEIEVAFEELFVLAGRHGALARTYSGLVGVVPSDTESRSETAAALERLADRLRSGLAELVAAHAALESALAKSADRYARLERP